jgi:hypothetical protein
MYVEISLFSLTGIEVTKSHHIRHRHRFAKPTSDCPQSTHHLHRNQTTNPAYPKAKHHPPVQHTPDQPAKPDSYSLPAATATDSAA